MTSGPVMPRPVRRTCGPPNAAGCSLAESISRAFNEIRREARLDEGRDFPSRRRSYVTHMIEDGYDAFFVQQQVGHEHASTTSICTGLSPRLPQPRRFRRDQQTGHHHPGNDERELAMEREG